MSELRSILSDVIADRATAFADAVTNVSVTPFRTFACELEEITDIELNTALGRDARESVLVHVTDRAALAELTIKTRLVAILFGQTVTLEIVRRKDNPTDPQVEFGCRKIVSGKDT